MKSLVFLSALLTFVCSSSAFAVCFKIEDRPITQISSVHFAQAPDRVCISRPVANGPYQIAFAKGSGRFVRFFSYRKYDDSQSQYHYNYTFPVQQANMNGEDFDLRTVISFNVEYAEGVMTIGHEIYKIKQFGH